ncbi:hypothetical protein D1227_07315 [Henriciella mobilis]|uniref:sulfotransferase family protein n=1 Tax=Henriciella mobilis TaxID=2305467 RepID=UPI000E66F5B7|nr:sulfotransferase family 2 domain-containing protein [Henriciella mobilis]RIJ17151.1 hypothetical protein D1231_05915 [Henriciella mobilis]RIJ22758.1 hypothetical protein D1227_07315 [Henriciella mobilis]
MLENKTAYFVVGMHRSGTSAVSGALQYLGGSHGQNLLEPAEDNPKGFWEARSVVNMNERILNALGARWDSIPSWVDGISYAPADAVDWARNTFLREVENAWEREFPDAEGSPVIKDPRLCFTLPLWEDVARAKGFNVRHLFVLREARGVARSLWQRNRLPDSAAERLWLQYNHAALSNLPEGTPILNFDDFTSAPADQLAMAGFDMPGDAAEDINAFATRLDTDFTEGFKTRPRHRPTLVRQTMSVVEDRAQLADPEAIKQDLDRIGFLQRVGDEMSGRIFRLGPPTRSRPAARHGERTAILHCHLFKNAGTSVDHILKTAFGDNWTDHEFPDGDVESNSDLVLSHIIANSAFDVFSTHTGNWYLDYETDRLTVLPIIFLRHPILRIQSAYQFERKQTAETAGSKLAKSTDLAGYITNRLSEDLDYSIKNFQARRLAAFVARRTIDIESQANEAFDRLPFIGLVEDFEASCERLEAYLKPHFPDFEAFSTKKNVTSHEKTTTEERVTSIREEVGESLFNRLVEANRIDLALFERLQASYLAHS